VNPALQMGRPTDLVVTPTGLRFLNRRFPCTIGRGGITTRKREGDGCTPVGVHGLIGMLYRPDRIARPADWALPIGPGDLWSDDVTDPDYNLMVSRPHPFGHERLRRADPQYDLVILTDWNWPEGIRGRGSAIFIHQWRRPGAPTAGCIGLPRAALHWIAPRIRHQTRLIVQGGRRTGAVEKP
jgi:L,D-peptidoglycan transpeptidase YkuD (ErfK/YbiS/YcfS/YnhG family)